MERERNEEIRPSSAYRPIGMSVYEFLRSRSLTHGEQTSLHFYGKKVSFAQLFERIEATAQALGKLGIGKGDVVTVSLPAIPEAV